MLTLLGIGANRVGLVGLLNQVLAGLVSLGVLLGVRDHLLDVLVAETRRRSDSHALVLVGGLVLGGDVDNTIFERHK